MATSNTQREAINEETSKANEKANTTKVKLTQAAREALFQGFNRHDKTKTRRHSN